MIIAQEAIIVIALRAVQTTQFEDWHREKRVFFVSRIHVHSSYTRQKYSHYMRTSRLVFLAWDASAMLLRR